MPGEPLVIFELGGGNGTNMRTILDHIRETAPRVYARTAYTVVEVAGAMAARQRAAAAAGGHANCTVVHADAVSWDGWGMTVAASLERRRGTARSAPGKSNRGRRSVVPPFVIALEVLDNLPHDKIVWRDGKWLQVEVARDETGALSEFLECVRRAR